MIYVKKKKKISAYNNNTITKDYKKQYIYIKTLCRPLLKLL